MPDAPAFLLFMAASLALLIVPGPAVMYIVARSIDQGRPAGIVSALGLAAGSGATFSLMGVFTDSIYATVAGAIAGRLHTDSRFPRVRRIAVATTYIALSALALLVHPTKL